MIVYFTGTGNSRQCARWLAGRLEDSLTDMGGRMRRGEEGPLSSDKPWVFVCPTYGWQAPMFLWMPFAAPPSKGRGRPILC